MPQQTCPCCHGTGARASTLPPIVLSEDEADAVYDDGEDLRAVLADASVLPAN